MLSHSLLFTEVEEACDIRDASLPFVFLNCREKLEKWRKDNKLHRHVSLKDALMVPGLGTSCHAA
jgi:hypothetical protein